MRDKKIAKLLFVSLVLTLLVNYSYSEPIDTSFTYQGQLKELGEPAMGLYDVNFTLYDADIGGSQIGDALLLEDVVVSNGLFSVLLDFGDAPFDGNIYWLQLEVKPRDVNNFTTLTPRQEINPAPYAVYAKTSGSSAGVIKGPGTANYLAKYLDPNTIIESIIYESGGNIGIGTTSPTAKLDVNGTVAATAFVGDGSGLTNLPAGVETDPTVDPNVKDGVSWDELAGIPAGFADGVDDVGSAAETDPTVDPNVKDGVSWSEISDIPSGFADGIDNEGSGSSGGWNSVTLTDESTKTISGLSAGKFYEFKIAFTQNTSAAYIRMRINEDSRNNYWRSAIGADSSGFGVHYRGGVDYWAFEDEDIPTYVDAGGIFGASLDLMPAGNTTIIIATYTHSMNFSGNPDNQTITTIGGRYEGSTGISSVTLFTSAGTMTGKILYRQVGP